jgi:hypothetical protein
MATVSADYCSNLQSHNEASSIHHFTLAGAVLDTHKLLLLHSIQPLPMRSIATTEC